MTDVYVAVEGLKAIKREARLLNEGRSPRVLSDTELYNLTGYPDVIGGLRRTSSRVRHAVAGMSIRLNALVPLPRKRTTPDRGAGAV